MRQLFRKFCGQFSSTCNRIPAFKCLKKRPSYTLAFLPIAPLSFFTLYCRDAVNTAVRDDANVEDYDASFVKEPNTGMNLPTFLHLSDEVERSFDSTKERPTFLVRLMAHGARQISFLRFNVYAIGFYVSSSARSQLQNYLQLEKLKAVNEAAEDVRDLPKDWLGDDCLSKALKLPIDVTLCIGIERITQLSFRVLISIFRFF